MSRDYVFTAWSEPKPDYDKCRYICWGIEKCPTTGKQHWQGFIIFAGRTHKMPAAKRIINGGDGCHLEPRRGSRQEARDYCRKDGEFTERGLFDALTKEQLFRQPIEFLKENHPEFYCRYYKGLERLQPKGNKHREVEIHVRWGKPRTGKTRYVMEMDSVYKWDHPFKWFDGYEGEEILLIDDYKKGDIARGLLLQILDGYRMKLEIKGSHTWALWKKVYITSNSEPRIWMTDAIKGRMEDNPVSSIVEVTK